jgi:hypothetical protein
MWRWLLLAALLGPAALTSRAAAALPELPAGATTRWVVAGPEEVVTWLAFDPATVRERLPADLRFITLGELAAGGAGWARAFLGEHPAQVSWGVSFLEFVRADTFTIDGREPRWPAHGAAALWFARVAPSDPADDPGPGRPYLALDLWMPDHAYAGYMLAKGYHARAGEVTLRRDGHGRWRGALRADGLRVDARCELAEEGARSEGSAGLQAIFPPANSRSTDVVRVALAGHRVRPCVEPARWSRRGEHPLARALPLGETTFQWGYELLGGTYPR